jgi:hypothetical protein
MSPPGCRKLHGECTRVPDLCDFSHWKAPFDELGQQNAALLLACSVKGGIVRALRDNGTDLQHEHRISISGAGQKVS